MLQILKPYIPKKLKTFLKKIKQPSRLDREVLSSQYLKGNGIEIGALHYPLKVEKGVKVTYVDRYDNKGLCQHYPEQPCKFFVSVDIVDDGEFLNKIGDHTQDFVIANHFVEHCQNPLLTLSHMHRVLKKGGILYLALPDKRYTFDVRRPITTLEHLFKDFYEGPEGTKRQHFEEWVDFVDDKQNVDDLIKQDYSIHYHAWTQAEILEMFLALKKQLGFKFDIEACLKNGIEFITILRKMD